MVGHGKVIIPTSLLSHNCDAHSSVLCKMKEGLQEGSLIVPRVSGSLCFLVRNVIRFCVYRTTVYQLPRICYIDGSDRTIITNMEQLRNAAVAGCRGFTCPVS
jgi:hypothetical protein